MLRHWVTGWPISVFQGLVILTLVLQPDFIFTVTLKYNSVNFRTIILTDIRRHRGIKGFLCVSNIQKSFTSKLQILIRSTHSMFLFQESCQKKSQVTNVKKPFHYCIHYDNTVTSCYESAAEKFYSIQSQSF
jgi:hypothetical protein